MGYVQKPFGLAAGTIPQRPPLNQVRQTVGVKQIPTSKREPSLLERVYGVASRVSDYFSGDTQTTQNNPKPTVNPVVKKENKRIYTDTTATYTKGSLIPGSNMNYRDGTQLRIPSSIGIMEKDDPWGEYKKGHQFAETITSSTDAERKKPLSSFINKSGSKVEQDADKSFIEHYSDPVTLERLKKAGINPKWGYDLTKKALLTPKINETDKPQNILPKDTAGVYTAGWKPTANHSIYNPWYNSKNGIDETKQMGKKGAISYAEYPLLTSTKGTIEHEMAHASYAEVLWPSLYKALGKKAPKFEGKMYSPETYMQRPSEVYAHFHEFRQNLEMKPGEIMTVEELVKRVEAHPEVQSGNFWQEFGYNLGSDGKPTKLDKEKKVKLVNAINTVASTDGKTENKMKFSGDRNSSYA